MRNQRAYLQISLRKKVVGSITEIQMAEYQKKSKKLIFLFFVTDSVTSLWYAVVNLGKGECFVNVYESWNSREYRIMICIDQYHYFDMQGRAYCDNDPKPVLFREINYALLQLERRFNTQNYPRSSTEIRTFSERKRKGQAFLKTDTSRKMKKEALTLTDKPITAPQGEVATFLIQVEYRQNATWQGHIVWVDKNEKKPFRSVLELLMLMNSALKVDDEDVVNEF